MHLTFEHWPFWRAEARSPEQDERWWRECYFPNPAEAALQSQPHWCALIGAYQCGKSVALAALRRANQQAFIVDYPLTNPPLDPSIEHENHLYRIMAMAMRVLRGHFTTYPEKLSLLSVTQKEFLRWLIERFDSPRSYHRWLDGLPRESLPEMQGIEYSDLYPTQKEVLDVEGQIEELVNLCRRIGYRDVLIIIDIEPPLYEDTAAQIQNILTWLEPMQQADFRLVIALPPDYTEDEVRELSRGRISGVTLQTTKERTWEIISRYLQVASQGKVKSLEQLLEDNLLNRLNNLVEVEYSTSSPGGWLNLVKILIDQELHTTWPLPETLYPDIRNRFYARCLPLRLDDKKTLKGVWRGLKWIPLEETSYYFIVSLAECKGDTVDHLKVQVSKENLHTQARRLRMAIEPDASQPVYLKSKRNEGYWLEHVV